MANICDYLRWRGDISLEERPFNDVDNIILSVLSYLDFTGIVPGERSGGTIVLSRACRKLIERGAGDVAPYVRSLAKVDTTFVDLIASSRRFGGAVLHSYVDIVDEQRSLQFSALRIDLSSGETYVSYRGTDSTLVGWREDFMLSFKVTEAQREALAYLDRAGAWAAEQGRRLLVGGHSKGGVLAEYAAAKCTDEVRERILRVYSNDGPGMSSDVMRVDGRSVLGDKLVRIVPSYSVVGMLFARQGDPRVIVQSSGAGIGQHDPTTWQVTRSGVKEALALQPDCVLLNDAIASWAADLSLAEREQVTNEVFDALGAGGATCFEEITATNDGLQQVLVALNNTDGRTREILAALVDRIVDTSVEAVRKSAQDTLAAWRRGTREAAETAARKVFKAGTVALRKGDIKIVLPRTPSN